MVSRPLAYAGLLNNDCLWVMDGRNSWGRGFGLSQLDWVRRDRFPAVAVRHVADERDDFARFRHY